VSQNVASAPVHNRSLRQQEGQDRESN
jgi:hypothetical protein